MSMTVKTEGFRIPGTDNVPHRPQIHRPFSDGSMTIETDLLASLMSVGSPHHNTMAIASPFAFSSSLPTQTHAFDYSMASPLSTSADRFHPAAIFNAMKFGHDNPEPPVKLSVAPETQERSRSQSSSRSSHIGKAPSSRSRTARKSMNDARPAPGSIQPRGRSAQVGRTQSFSGHICGTSQSDGKPMGLGIGLDTHVEGEQTDSISPPDFGLNGTFSMAIPRGEHDGVSWGSGSMPSMLTGSLGSFGETADEAIIDSPITPARALAPLADDSFKKQRRRECHNQVEKRRREHINAKIEELSQLLPSLYNTPDNEEVLEDEEEEDIKPQDMSGKKKKNKRASSAAKAQKDAAQCKGRILSLSVQYIRDLKHITDIQAGRIAHLEAMLMTYGVNPAVQPPPVTNGQSNLYWLGDNHANNSMTNQQALDNLMQGHNLEVMRPSPEPERPFTFDNVNLDVRSSWANSASNNNGHIGGAGTSIGNPHGEPHSSAADVLMSFEPSPNTLSSGMSLSDIRRSSDSVSSVASYEGEHLDSLNMHSPTSMSMNLNMSDVRGRQREKTVRKDSQIELQMSMSGLLSGHRDEESGGMRW